MSGGGCVGGAITADGIAAPAAIEATLNAVRLDAGLRDLLVIAASSPATPEWNGSKRGQGEAPTGLLYCEEQGHMRKDFGSVLHLPFCDINRSAGRAGLKAAIAAMPSVFSYLEFVAAMRFGGGVDGDGAETCKVALSDARREGWVVGLFGHWGGSGSRQVPTYFNMQRLSRHPVGRLAQSRAMPVWRPWLERAIGMGAMSAIALGRPVLQDAGWVTRIAGSVLEVSGEDSRINVHEDIQPYVRVARRPTGWMQAMAGRTRSLADRRAPLVTLQPPAALADLLVFGDAADLGVGDLARSVASWSAAEATDFREVACNLQRVRPRRGRAALRVIDAPAEQLAERLWITAQETLSARLACA